MKATKFTFKKEPRETGLRAVGHSQPDTVIKLEKLPVGRIIAPCWSMEDGLWRVQVRIAKAPTPEEPCEFRNAMLKKRFETEPEARQFLQSNFDSLIAWGLHQDKESDE